uniref:Transmembrane protein n=1 Tax=Strongyloides papillosus TaxID=174720 RepID=A0A0N5C3D7_STREA
MNAYQDIETISLIGDYSKKDEYILKKIKVLLLILFFAATILTTFVFTQALYTPKKEEYIRNLLHNNATIVDDEWRFTFNETNNKIGNCETFKNIFRENEDFSNKLGNDFIKIGNDKVLKRINLEGKKFTDCLSKYPRSINFQKLCLERLSLSLINDIAKALINQKKKNDSSVVAYCIPKDYLNSLDKIYLLEKIGNNYLTIKSNILDYFANFPVEISHRYTNCKFLDYLVKNHSIFDRNITGEEKNKLRNIKTIKEELEKMCFKNGKGYVVEDIKKKLKFDVLKGN